MEPSPVPGPATVSERDPLLAHPNDLRQSKKRFYRPRPLWLVPFAVIAALVRGMTLAPRVQVFTQLACARVLATSGTSDLASTALASAAHARDKCLADPAVQAGAARLQTTFMIVMGISSALSTSYWGTLGERLGRMRVLALATFGLFVSDATFALVSSPHMADFAARHGPLLLALAPFLEGALGGWASLQGTTIAYLSDCTSDGKSRARVFSRFNGVFYLGFSIGPTLGAYFIRHPIIDIPYPSMHPSGSPTTTAAAPADNITSVFLTAAFFSLLNLFLVLFVFPESLHSKKPPPEPSSVDAGAAKSGLRQFADGFKHAASVFAPRVVELPNGKKRKDWGMTALAAGLFFYLLALGVFQIKYLYAEHVYGWGSEQLSYYIFLAGGLRALALLVVLPFIINTFKPRPKPPKPNPNSTSTSLTTAYAAQQLAAETHFDLLTARLSLLLDALSHAAVSLAPALGPGGEPMFVCFSVVSSFAAGVLPTVQSLALGLVKAQGGPGEAGRVIGAIGALQAVAMMILGPLLFGVIYARTVAFYPKAIFNVACAIAFVAFVCMSFVRAPAAPKRTNTNGGVARRVQRERPRGRSRRTKDLRSQSTASVGTEERGSDSVRREPMEPPAGVVEVASHGAEGSKSPKSAVTLREGAFV